MTAPNTLPTIDGKALLRPKSKSTDRHNRERSVKIAHQIGLSEIQFRRAKYVLKYGTPEIEALISNGKLSVWRAYTLIRNNREAHALQIIEADLKKKGSGLL